ncbi:transposase DNA-binding-containing protein [Microcoleus anatoxicus]|uniref:transposase DNA-binding-containing protein n=1 Tax=Microcoleus anatoxicus TaxID=2705319 RepID=UPI0036736240
MIDQWVRQELEKTQLGDTRRTNRFMKIWEKNILFCWSQMCDREKPRSHLSKLIERGRHQ